MAEPKKRLTSTRSGKRKLHIKITSKSLFYCKKCKSPIMPHRVCQNCGYYKSRDILKIAQKEQEKEAKRKARAEQDKDKSDKNTKESK